MKLTEDLPTGDQGYDISLILASALQCLTLILVIALIIKSRILRRFFSSPEEETLPEELPVHHVPSPPPTPPSVPVLGHLHMLSKYSDSPWKGFDAIRQQYGDVVQLQLGAYKAVLVSSPDIMREVLLTKGEIFCNRPSFDRYKLIFGGDRKNSLALCDWSDMQKFRRHLAKSAIIPRHGTDTMRVLDSTIETEISDLLVHLKNGGSTQATFSKDVLLQACHNIFTNFLCSRKFSYDDEEFKRIVFGYDFVFYDVNQCYSTDFMPYLTSMGVNRKYLNEVATCCDELRKWVEELIVQPRFEELQRRIAELKNGESLEHKDFLDGLLEHFLKDPETFTWPVCLFEIGDLLGGSSAVGNLTMRLLGYVSLDEEVQELLYKEASEALAKSGGSQITLDCRPDLLYHEGAIFESLRLASSPIVPHVASENATLAGFAVEKDTMVMFNSFHLNTDPTRWSEPEKFDPRRFVVRNAQTGSLQIHKPDHFFPFSAGRRSCLGYKMVQTIGMMTVANLLLHYKIRPVDPSQVTEQIMPPKGTLALLATGCYSFELIPRQNSQI